MKIAVASDIHGSLTATRAFLKKANELGAEKILLLGDLYYHGVRNPLPDGYDPMGVASLLNQNASSLIVIRGNCDSDVDCTVSAFEMAEEAYLLVGKKTVFATHGDKFSIDCLPKGKADLLLYGHYHTGFIKEKDGVIVANPGSLSLPKNGTERSFLLLDETELILYSLSGDVLDQRIL